MDITHIGFKVGTVAGSPTADLKEGGRLAQIIDGAADDDWWNKTVRSQGEARKKVPSENFLSVEQAKRDSVMLVDDCQSVLERLVADLPDCPTIPAASA